MKTRYYPRKDYHGDNPCIHPLAMAELLIRINNKSPRYKGLGLTIKELAPPEYSFGPYYPSKHN